MPTDTNPLIPPELLEQVEATARAQNRMPAEVVTEALNKYLRAQKWTHFIERNEGRARDLGITEEDIPRLISEVRLENKQRGR